MPKSRRIPRSKTQPHFRLFIAGTSERSALALIHLRALGDEVLGPQGYALEVVDLYQQAARAEADGIFAAPALIRVFPAPRLCIVGDLTDRKTLLAALGGHDLRRLRRTPSALKLAAR